MRVRRLVSLLLWMVLLAALLGGCARNADTPANATSGQPAPTSSAAGESAPPQAAVPGQPFVAQVNGVAVTETALQRAKQQILSRYQQIYAQFGMDVQSLLAGAKGHLFELEIEDEALELATMRAIVSAELTRRQAAIPQDAVEAEFSAQYVQFLAAIEMSEEQFEAAFASGGVANLQTGDLTFDQFIEYAKLAVRESLELEALQERLAGPIEPTQEELMAFFEENRDSYKTPEQVRVSHILVASRELADQILTELQAGGDFSTLAEQYSTDAASAARGGDLGWVTRGRTVPAFEEAAFATPEGELSGVVETDYGFHLIKVTGHQVEREPPFEEVSQTVASEYAADVKAQKFSDWYTAARPAASVTITDPLLSAFRRQQEDVDLGLQAFLDLHEQGTSQDKYLSYIIGSIYESKLETAQSRLRTLASVEAPTPSQVEEANALRADIADYQAQAFSFYQQALQQLGEDSDLRSRIEALSPADSDAGTPEG